MAYELKELPIGGVLDQAIRISKDSFGLLFSIVAVGYLPMALLTGLAGYFFSQSLQRQRQSAIKPR